MVFYGQDTGCKLQESHDELGVLLPLEESEHNICTISSRWTALCCAVARK